MHIILHCFDKLLNELILHRCLSHYVDEEARHLHSSRECILELQFFLAEFPAKLFSLLLFIIYSHYVIRIRL